MLDLQAIETAAAARLHSAARPLLTARPANRLTLHPHVPKPISQLAALATCSEARTLAPRPESRPYKLSKADADAAHAEPWDEAACARFAARVSLFLRRGINATDADDLAERLHLRDMHADDRALCLECRHLTGRPGTWRCGNHRAAGVGRELPAAIAMRLQRCPGYSAEGERR